MSRILIALVAMIAVAEAQEATPAPSAPTPTPAQAPMPPAQDAPPTPAQDIAPTPPQQAPAQDVAAPALVSAPAADVPEGAQLAPADMGEQAIGAALGVAIGGRTTPGGLRASGSYLYQLAAQDWFDGTAAFTFGSGAPDCFRDRMDVVICDHGLADGYSVELSANVRRFFAGNDKFWPFARAGLGVALVRFADDDVTGVAFPIHLGAGLRVSVNDGIAVTGQAELDIGIAAFNNGPGAEPQLGLNVTFGVEFKL